MSAANQGDPALSETFAYSATGNLLSRSRLAGSFTYPGGAGARPHAPIRLGTTTIAYDANGNMVSDGSRTLNQSRAHLVIDESIVK